MEEPEEQESPSVDQMSDGTYEEMNADMCEQDDYEVASVSSHGDFVGDYEFGVEADTIPDFECLSPADLVKEQARMIREVVELLVVNETVAGNLLRHYKWRQERLLGAYFENPKNVLREIGQAEVKKKRSRKHGKSTSANAASTPATQALKAKYVFCGRFCFSIFSLQCVIFLNKLF